jgi:L-arabinokinase
VDLVVSKPGYGLLSDCIVNEKPLLYVDRTDFLEYPILVAALERYLQHQHIPAEELYRGNLQPYLERLQAGPPPRDRIGHHGAAVAAERILEFLDTDC